MRSATSARSTSPSPTGCVPPGGEHEIAVAAVTLRHDRELEAEDIAAALAPLPAHERPWIVHVVDRIPVTTWYRPVTGPLRAAGIPEPSPDRTVWYRDSGKDSYRPLTATARRRIVREAAEPDGRPPARAQAPRTAPAS